MPIFLDEISRKHELSGFNVFEVDEFQGIQKIYVVEDTTEEDIFARFLLERNVYEYDRVDRIERLFTKIIQPSIFEQVFAGQGPFLQILPMNSGEFCNIRHGFKKLLPQKKYHRNPLPTWYAEIQRQVEGTHVTATMVNTMKDFGPVKTVFFCDTCGASGSTDSIGANYVIQKWGKASDYKSLEHIVIVSACTSWQALEKVSAICKKAKVQLTCILGQVIFEVVEGPGVLGLCKTDLPILMPESEGKPGSVTTRDFYERAIKYNQGKLICAVGDVGASLRKTVQYLKECMEEMAILKMDLNKPEWSWILHEYVTFRKMDIYLPAHVHSHFVQYM